MLLQTLIQPTTKRPLIQYLQGGRLRNTVSLVRANFNLSTLLLIGAFIQSAIVFLAPGPYALLLPAVLLLIKVADTLAMTFGFKHNHYMDEVIPGKFSAQLLDKNSEYNQEIGGEQVVVMMLATRSNHPLGLFAEGFKEIGDYFRRMVLDLEKLENKEAYGFMGMSSWSSNTDRSSGNEFLTISYWRSVDDIHRFAHSPVHREAWDWWNKTYKQHPYLAIMHEIYCVPKKQWESIYVNYHPTQLAGTTFPKKNKQTGEVEWLSPVVDANRGPLRTSAGRLSKSGKTGDENEIAYGKDPY